MWWLRNIISLNCEEGGFYSLTDVPCPHLLSPLDLPRGRGDQEQLYQTVNGQNRG